MTQVSFRKVQDDDDEGFELDPTIAGVLAVPVEKEDELLVAVEKANGGESVAKTAAMVARGLVALRKAYGGLLPEQLQKELAALVGPAQASPRPVPAPAASVAKAKAKPRPVEESLAEIKRIAKDSERRLDARAEADLQAVAESIRKRSGYTLTKAEAVVKALEKHPDLYESARRHNLRRLGALEDEARVLAKAEQQQSALERAGDKLRRDEPNLTREQAIAKALAKDPSLYGKE